jgi:hypothetical protein
VVDEILDIVAWRHFLAIFESEVVRAAAQLLVGECLGLPDLIVVLGIQVLGGRSSVWRSSPSKCLGRSVMGVFFTAPTSR